MFLLALLEDVRIVILLVLKASLFGQSDNNFQRKRGLSGGLNMHSTERFNRLLSEWLFAIGAPANAEPMEFTIARAKSQILRDVRSGIVPPGVKSFSDLHDYVDANGYGDAFEWPDLPSESEDDAYMNACCAFWNKVQNELHAWIATGEMLKSIQRQSSEPSINDLIRPDHVIGPI